MDYEEFLRSKRIEVKPSGFSIDPSEVNPVLFDFQRDIVVWALKKGKACVFAGCGSGKSLILLEWSNHVHKYTGGDILILAPLAVCHQMVDEGKKININVNTCTSQSDVKPGINITNYEKLHNFDTSHFVGVVTDESSILKSFESKYRNEIISKFVQTPFKLACSATPSPNDIMELANHAEFMGVMKRPEFLTVWFVHDGGRTSQWRLKRHAVKPFWEFVASWAVMMQLPSDLGYEDNGFKLPPINIEQVVVGQSEYSVTEALTLADQRAARKESLDDRINAVIDIINKDPDKKWLLWCNLNIEQDTLTKKLSGRCVSIAGSTPVDDRLGIEEQWRLGDVPIMISKPSVYGFGVNWQHCHNVIYVGISHSFEEFYQSVRRCWRFGQKNIVNVYVVTSVKEGPVVRNISRKEKEYNDMLSGMISATSELSKKELHATSRIVDLYNPQIPMSIPDWLKSDTSPDCDRIIYEEA